MISYLQTHTDSFNTKEKVRGPYVNTLNLVDLTISVLTPLILTFFPISLP